MPVAEKPKKTRRKKVKGLSPELVFCFAAGADVNKDFCFNNSSVLPKNARYCAPNNCTSPYRKCRACTQQGVNGSGSKVYNAESGLCYVHHDQGADFDKKNAVGGGDDGDGMDWDGIAKRSDSANNFMARAAAILGTKPDKEPIVIQEKPAKKSVPKENIKEAINAEFEKKEVESPEAMMAKITTEKPELMEIDINLIDRNPDQPRIYFRKAGLLELQGSLEEGGQRVPVIVVITPDGRYMLVDGERRWRSAKEAKQKKLLAIVYRKLTREQIFIYSLICNFSKEEHHHYEVAMALKRLRTFDMFKDLGKTEFISQVARVLGRSITWVDQRYIILSLHKDVLDRMHPETPENEQIAFTKGVEIAKVPQQFHVRLADKVVKKKMSVKDTKMHVNKVVGDRREIKRGKQSGDFPIFIGYVNRTRDDAKYFMSLGKRRLEAMFKDGRESQQETINLIISSLEWQENVLEMIGGSRNKKNKQ